MTNKERFKEIFISQVTRPGAADLLAWLGTTDFFEAPASTRFRGAYPGGLVEHSLNVYYALLWFMQTEPWRSWRSRASLSGGCSGIMPCGGGYSWNRWPARLDGNSWRS